jgi:hypothetical protein
VERDGHMLVIIDEETIAKNPGRKRYQAKRSERTNSVEPKRRRAKREERAKISERREAIREERTNTVERRGAKSEERTKQSERGAMPAERTIPSERDAHGEMLENTGETLLAALAISANNGGNPRETEIAVAEQAIGLESTTPIEPNIASAASVEKPKYDRKTYQRELMRKRRAAARGQPA